MTIIRKRIDVNRKETFDVPYPSIQDSSFVYRMRKDSLSHSINEQLQKLMKENSHLRKFELFKKNPYVILLKNLLSPLTNQPRQIEQELSKYAYKKFYKCCEILRYNAVLFRKHSPCVSITFFTVMFHVCLYVFSLPPIT